MRAAVALATLRLALCVAAALLRAPTHCQSQEGGTAGRGPDNEQCDGYPFHIEVIQYNYTKDYIYFRTSDDTNKLNYVSVPFGHVMTVRCSAGISQAKSFSMTRDGHMLPTKNKFSGIEWSTRKQDALKSQYEYVCTNVESNCKRSVMMFVTPRVEVISANAQLSQELNGHFNYIVQYGDSMTVTCFGPDASRLAMSLRGETLVTERESDTAIKRFEREPLDLQTSEFVCTDVFTTYNISVTVRVVPTVYFQSQNKTITTNMHFDMLLDKFMYHIDYSDSIEVYCSGSRAIRLIQEGRGQDIFVPTKTCESTTVKYMKKLKLEKLNFDCSGCKVGDTMNRVQVIVTPRMEVRSPNVLRFSDGTTGEAKYVIKYGQGLEIICSAGDSAQLRIKTSCCGNCAVQVVNETAVKCVVKELTIEAKITCYETSAEIGWMPQKTARVGVLPADVEDFRCVSHRMQYLNCSWMAAENTINLTLSYLEDGILTSICGKLLSSSLSLFAWLQPTSTFCTWDYSPNQIEETEVITLILKTCNNYGCSDRSFPIKHASVTKLAPPERPDVLNTTARGAVLAWQREHPYLAGEYIDLEYKVQYWYSGIEARDVNSSLVKCSDGVCKIELILPCPGQFYQVSIYQKLKTAVGEEFWSDPSSVPFHTSIVDNVKTVDPTCSWEPTKTPEVMKFFIQKRKHEVHIEMEPLKEKANSLKAKLAALQTFSNEKKGAR